MRAPATLVVLAVALAGCATEPPAAPTSPHAPGPTGADALVAPTSASTLDLPDLPTRTEDDLHAWVVRAQRNATAGHETTFLVQVRGLDGRNATVRLEGPLGAGEAPVAGGEGTDLAGAFVTIRVPEEAPVGATPLALRVDAEGAAPVEIPDAATLHVLPDAPPFAAAQAVVALTLRDARTGEVVSAYDPALSGAAFPRTADAHVLPETLPVSMSPRPNVIAGMAAALQTMQAGESRTVTIPPDQGYGDFVELETVPRVERLAREERYPIQALAMPRRLFDDHIRSTAQGDPAQMEGATFQREVLGETWTFRALEVGEEIVRFRADPPAGERHTLHTAWPNASVVTSASPDEIVFFTTPATGVGEPVTWRPGWENASELVELTEAEYVVRHSPGIGAKCNVGTLVGQVQEVDETSIRIVRIESQPLVGLTLILDVELLPAQA